MAQAASAAQNYPREISFKHTVQIWTEWLAYRPLRTSTAYHALIFELTHALKYVPLHYSLVQMPTASVWRR